VTYTRRDKQALISLAFRRSYPADGQSEIRSSKQLQSRVNRAVVTALSGSTGPQPQRRSVYWPLFAVLTLVLLSISCTSKENLTIAERGVGQFHAQLDAQQYHAIYAGADERFRRAGSETQMTLFFQAIHRKLGTLKEATLSNYQIKSLTGQGTFVTLVYNTGFSQGVAVETFAIRIENGQPVLVGYNISSNALIIN